MAQFTLDDIRAAAEKKFGSTDIQIGDTTVRLLNALQLPKAKRDALTAIEKRFDAEDAEADMEQTFRDALRVVAENDHQANVLLDSIGDNLAVLATVFEKYTSGEELGEASASAS